MKLDDFLKPKQVRCINGGNHGYLTDGKVYDVIGAIFGRLKMRNDNGDNIWYDMTCFELVIESAEPKFKVGDKVYKYGETDVKTVLEVFEDGYMRISNYPHRVNHEVLCHATPKNHAVLSKPFPAIEFEQPLTQADIDNEAVDKLAQAMKNKLAKKREQGYHGWETCKHGDLVQLLINHVDEGDPIDVANFCAFLFARGEQLTQGGTR